MGEVSTILVVDDDPAIRTMLSDLLGTDGYRVLEASDGEEALARVGADKPALVLLDWRMPGMTGLEVCRAVREHPDDDVRETPVIIMTALTTPDDTRVAMAAGASEFLEKPFRPAHVRSRVAFWLLNAG